PDDPDDPAAPPHEDVIARWERVLGPDHPETAELRRRLRAARPAWRVALSLPSDASPVAGRPLPIDIGLVQEYAADPPGRIMITPSCRTAASVDPPEAVYDAGDAPARFELTAAEPGDHELRFTLYDHATGLALQDLRTVIRVGDDRGDG
ncbi:tetratricopeptide repeat protein, partial [Streptomyces niveiscabiei]